MRIQIDGLHEWDFFGRGGRSFGQVVFNARDTSVSARGIFFHQESGPDAAGGYASTTECRLAGTDLLLFRRVEKFKDNGQLAYKKFFGPFGVSLKPNP
jgi:hypothetical protein